MSNFASLNTTFTKYIRVTGDRHAKFVEFDFAINDPTLFVELLLPQQAFTNFCRINEVVEMNEEQEQLNDALERKWRYGSEPTLVLHARQNSDQEDQS